MRKEICNRFQILISKKISDSLSDEEDKELNKYLSANRHAEHYYADLKKVWDLTYTLADSCTFKIDVSEEWEKFMQSQNLTNHKNI
jgi:hypothetical protein